MNCKIKIAGLILLTQVFASFSFAQSQSSIQSLDSCIKQALENNLMLKVGKVSLDKAKELQGTAFNIDKTALSLSQDPTSGGNPDNSIAVSQSFDFPSVYVARYKLLKAETNLERNALELTRNELIKEVTDAYYLLLYFRECMTVLSEQDSLCSKFLFLATQRLKTGSANRLEQINAERLYNENKLTLFNAQKNFQNVQMRMQTLLNTDAWIEPQEKDLPLLKAQFQAEPNALQSPLVQMYEAKLKVSERNVRLQNQQFIPSFDFSLRNQFVIKGFNPYHIDRSKFDKGNFTGFEAGLRIPLFFGEQLSRVKAAKKEVEMANIAHQNVLLNWQQEFHTLMNKFHTAEMKLDYYLETGNAQADEITRISQLAYEKGEINYIEYTQNLKTAIEIRLQYADAVKEYNQLVITINYLQGKK